MSIELSLLMKEQPAPTNMFWRGEMPNLKTAAQRVGSPTRIAIYGDSNACGQGGGTGTNGTIDARKNSWPVKMANTLGWQDGSFFGDSNLKAISETVSGYDPRISLGSFSAGSLSIPGGCFLTCVGASSSNLVFTPATNSDTIKVWYPTTSSATNSFQIIVDGITKATLSQASANSMKFELINVTLGQHVIEIKNIGSGTCFIMGIETYNSQNASPVLLITSFLGSSLINLSTTSSTSPWTHLSGLLGLRPDVVITHCTINDISSGNPTQDSLTNITTINHSLSTINCDVVNTVSFPFFNDGATDGRLDLYKNVLLNNAITLRGSFADFRAVCGGTFTFSQKMGYTFNSNHPNALGYQTMANFISKIFQ